MLVDKRQFRSYFRSNARPNCCTTARDRSVLALGISVIDNVACNFFFLIFDYSLPMVARLIVDGMMVKLCVS